MRSSCSEAVRWCKKHFHAWIYDRSSSYDGKATRGTSVNKNQDKDLLIYSVRDGKDEDRRFSLVSKYCSWSGLEAMLVTALMKPYKWVANVFKSITDQRQHYTARPSSDVALTIHSAQFTALISIGAFRSQVPITRFFLFTHWNWLFSVSHRKLICPHTHTNNEITTI